MPPDILAELEAWEFLVESIEAQGDVVPGEKSKYYEVI